MSTLPASLKVVKDYIDSLCNIMRGHDPYATNALYLLAEQLHEVLRYAESDKEIIDGLFAMVNLLELNISKLAAQNETLDSSELRIQNEALDSSELRIQNEKLQHKLATVIKARESLQIQFTTVMEERDDLRGHVAIAKEKLGTATANLDALGKELSTTKDELATVSTEKDDLRGRVSTVQEKLGTATTNLDAMGKELSTTKCELSTTKCELSTTKDELSTVTAERDGHRVRASIAEKDLGIAATNSRALQKELAIVTAKHHTITAERDALGKGLAAVTKEQDSLRTQLATVTDKHKAVTTERNALYSQLETSTTECDVLGSQLDITATQLAATEERIEALTSRVLTFGQYRYNLVSILFPAAYNNPDLPATDFRYPEEWDCQVPLHVISQHNDRDIENLVSTVEYIKKGLKDSLIAQSNLLDENCRFCEIIERLVKTIQTMKTTLDALKDNRDAALERIELLKKIIESRCRPPKKVST